MKRKKGLFFGSLIFAAMFMVFFSFGNSTATAAQKVYRMKMQSAYPRGDLSMGLLDYFAKDAAKKSNDRLKISVFAEPELVPADQLFEATQKGTLDMFQAVAAMWGGVMPVGNVEFGLPFAFHIPGDLPIQKSSDMVRKFFYDSGFVKLLRQQYAKHGLYWLDMHSYGALFTLSRKPVHTCQDLKGLKVRAEGDWQKYYDMLGSQGIFIPGSESYMGLKLGTIDASQWDVSAIVGLHWNQVAPYWLLGLQNDVVPGQIVMNMKSWKALPPDLQTALQDAAKDYYYKLLEVYTGEMAKVDKLVKEGKVIKSFLDPECEKQAAGIANKLWDETAKMSPAAGEAVELIRTWRKTLK
jgi:TRAP-type C4-dicarboxylate transport system substrate-binding protein